MSAVHEQVLSNGVRLAVAHRPDLPVTAVAVAVGVGWRDSPAGESGMAHLFEHLVLSGLEGSGPGGYARRIEGMGGRFNASTRADLTVFHAIVPSEFTPQVLSLQARLVTAPSVDEASLARERAVVTEEVRVRGQASPYGRFPIAPLRAVMFQRPGNRDEGAAVVADPTVEAALEFHRSEYAPGRIGVAVVASAGADATELAREAFGAIPVRTAAPARSWDEPILPGCRQTIVRPGVPYPAAAVGYRVPDPADERFLPVLVLADALAERGVSHPPEGFMSVTSAVDLLGDPLGVRDPTGLAVRGLLHQPDPSAEDRLHESLADFARVEESEVRPSAATLAARLARGMDDAVGQATALAVRMRLGQSTDLAALAARIRAVDVAEVRAAAADLVAGESFGIALTPGVG